MANNIPAYLLEPSKGIPPGEKMTGLTFLDKTIANTARTIKAIYLQAEHASRKSLIQNLNPHIKLIALIYMAIIISIVHNLYNQLYITGFILVLFIIARLRITEIFRKIFILSVIFGFIVVIPASLNIITQGDILFTLFRISKPLDLWIIRIPMEVGLTDNGIRVVGLFFMRVLNSISFAMLIVYTTSFPAFVKSFKVIGVPDTFLMVISLTYKYIFILSRTIEETYFALKSRLSGNIKRNSIRDLVGGRVFFIFRRSRIIYEGTYYAMVSRGYNGKIILASQNRLNHKDFISLVVILAFGIILVLL
jgi:cobalt/nickel transport system permease protein